MKIKSLIFILCFLFLIGCQPKNSSKSRLKQRVNLYYTHILKGEYGLAWDFLWHDAKRKRNRDEWAAFALGFDEVSKMTGFELKSISLRVLADKRIGYVESVAMIYNQKLKKNAREETEDLWLFENGDWFRFLE